MAEDGSVRISGPDGMPDDILRFHRLRSEFENQTDRGVAIIGAAVVDTRLEVSLRARLSNTQFDKSNSLFDRLFKGYGPLASFSARQDMALAMDLIGPETHADIKIMRDIRNAFAHWLDDDNSRESLTFSTPTIADRINNFSVVKNPPQMLLHVPRTTTREKYILATWELDYIIRAASMLWGAQQIKVTIPTLLR